MSNEGNRLRQPLLLDGDGENPFNAHLQQQPEPPSYDERLVAITAAQETTTCTSSPPPPSDVTPHTDNNELRQRRKSARILDRDAAFFQSRGRWSVRHISRGEARLLHTPEGGLRRQAMMKQFWNDWFYTLALQKTYVLMIILFLGYTAMVFLFAFVYLFVSLIGQTSAVDPNDGSTHTELFCDMDIHDHMEALYFSLSTMTTIGYGVSDYYFGGCWTPLMLVLAQVCCAITFNAVAVGLIFQRISRGHKRAKTILFSDKAAIRRVRGIPYLYFRIAELRHHHLLEATVRAYCVRHERHQIQGNDVETTHFVTKPMKLCHENVASSHILMSLPQVLVHRMDQASPLMPTYPWYDAHGVLHPDVRTSNDSSPKICLPSKGDATQEFVRETKEIESFLLDRETEIVVLLEGTDELTGAAIQTRHSYTCEELMWDARFIPCTIPYTENLASAAIPRGFAERVRQRRGDPPLCVVDFARFHQTLPAPVDSNSCPYVLG
jgi:hypothetical protein